MPFVSVIMPAYNAEKTVVEAVESVLNQTYKDFELIVINDCSKDKTADVLEKIAVKDARVRVLHNRENSGVSATRNYGVSEAQGEWIAFLDSDDMWRSDKLEKQIEVVKSHPEAVLSYTASSFIFADGTASSYIMRAEEKTSYKTLLKKNLVSCSSAMVKTDIMKNIKMPNDAMHEDYYVWLTILKEHKYAYGVDEPLLIYRLSENSKSSNRIKSAKMLFNSYRAVGYGKIRTFLLVLGYTYHSVTKRYNIRIQQEKKR